MKTSPRFVRPWPLVALALCGVLGLLSLATPRGAGEGSAQAAEPGAARWIQARDACPEPWRQRRPVEGWNRGFEVAGQSRSFWLMLPRGEGPAPLLLALHGTTEDGAAFARRARLEDFVAKGFVVVAPSGEGNGTVWPVWDALHAPGEAPRVNKDLAFFDKLLPCLASHLSLDRDRLFVGGHSAGGIMTNYVLQRRSEVFAGGIVASGVFSLTSPAPAPKLAPLHVIVTWGGDGDRWQGRAGGVAVRQFDFVEQASLASRFYDQAPAATQVACQADVGHAWLSMLNGWMAEQLLAHPAGRSSPGVPGPPKVAGVRCSARAFEGPAGAAVACPLVKKPACTAACQLLADCAVTNATVGPVLDKQMQALGFSGEGNRQCGGCVAQCESSTAGGDPADEEVLACLQARQAAARCGPGIEGAAPLMEAVGACCGGKHREAGVCRQVCQIIRSNSVAAPFFPVCR